jgi:hypothetical protein
MDSPTKSKNMSFFIGIPYKLKEGNYDFMKPVLSTGNGKFTKVYVTATPPPSPVVKSPLPKVVQLISLVGTGSLSDIKPVDLIPPEVLKKVVVKAPIFSDKLFEVLQVFDPLS